ncbi:MAG: hypothetical protein NTY69_06500 [Methylococcales bacterium]|nr:hypothetical protein [Methylococcales bacterium]
MFKGWEQVNVVDNLDDKHCVLVKSNDSCFNNDRTCHMKMATYYNANTVLYKSYLSSSDYYNCDTSSKSNEKPVLSEPTSKQVPVPSVKIIENEFDKNIQFRGILSSEIKDASSGKQVKGDFFLRSWLDKNIGTVKHQLYLDTKYKWSWINWNSAHADDTSVFETTNISSDVDCKSVCTFYETIGIEITDDYLKNRLNNGFRIKISGHSGDEIIIQLTTEQIKAQLDAISSKSKESNLPTVSNKKERKVKVQK